MGRSGGHSMGMRFWDPARDTAILGQLGKKRDCHRKSRAVGKHDVMIIRGPPMHLGTLGSAYALGQPCPCPLC